MEQKIGFNDTWFRIIGIPMIGILVPPVFFKIFWDTQGYWISATISIFYTTIYWHLCRFVFIKTNTLYPSLKDHLKRLSITLFFCVLIIIIICPLMNKVLIPSIIPEAMKLIQFNIPGLFEIYAANFTIFLAIAAIYEGMRNLKNWQDTEAEKERLEKEQIASQLEGLKSQVNPHFLFNSLNTLVHLIPEDTERSQRFVRQLSKIYRYFLETTNEKTVSLRTEMDFVNSYTYLLKERFGDNLHIKIDDTSICGDCEIVPFSLQLILENCIKHNIISQDKPLYISILVNKHFLVIRNNLQPKNQTQTSTGVGLKNIQNRYHLLDGKWISVVKTDKIFEVTLPLLYNH